MGKTRSWLAVAAVASALLAPVVAEAQWVGGTPYTGGPWGGGPWGYPNGNGYNGDGSGLGPKATATSCSSADLGGVGNGWGNPWNSYSSPWGGGPWGGSPWGGSGAAVPGAEALGAEVPGAAVRWAELPWAEAPGAEVPGWCGTSADGGSAPVRNFLQQREPPMASWIGTRIFYAVVFFLLGAWVASVSPGFKGSCVTPQRRGRRASTRCAT